MGGMAPQGELRFRQLTDLKSKASLAQMYRRRAQRHAYVCASAGTAQMSQNRRRLFKRNSHCSF